MVVRGVNKHRFLISCCPSGALQIGQFRQKFGLLLHQRLSPGSRGCLSGVRRHEGRNNEREGQMEQLMRHIRNRPFLFQGQQLSSGVQDKCCKLVFLDIFPVDGWVAFF